MYVEINSIEDLNNMKLDGTKNYKLMRNLDFKDDESYDNPANKSTYTTGAGWLSAFSHPGYQATFEGNGYTISNLYINRPSTQLQGLFHMIGRYGKVQNLHIRNAYVIALRNTGVFTGLLVRGKIFNCSTTGYIHITADRGGGFLGVGYGQESRIENCYADVTVKGTVECGGFCGFWGADNQWNLSPIRNCYSMGTIHRLSGSNDRFGSFCGFHQRSQIINCYSTGKVIYDDAPNPTNKGFVGTAIDAGDGNYADTGNFFDRQMSEQNTTAGNAKGENTSTLFRIKTFKDEGWDIATSANWTNEVWRIRDKKDYPRFWWEIFVIRNKVQSIMKQGKPITGDSQWF